jgi:hypothetical protein
LPSSFPGEPQGVLIVELLATFANVPARSCGEVSSK